jgi:hypothetical protein
MTSTGGTSTQAPRQYDSLADFYNADPARLGSREVDVGLWWRESQDGPIHRAAWVKETGEVYLARLGPAEEGVGAVEVLARARTREQLELALRGWREQCGTPSSLTWLRGRVGRLGADPRRARRRLPAAARRVPV